MMSGSNPVPTLFFLLIILSVTSFKLIHSTIGNNINFCPGIEKEALLSFKQSLQDPENILSSWNDTPHDEINCCKWNGVVCDNLTGHVQQLHLQSYGFSGKINPSLLNLSHLRYLDLSLNDFNETIPSFIGSLTRLEHLNLSRAGFYGTVPHTIGNLSNLHTLSLESDRSNTYMNVDTLDWFFGFSHMNVDNLEWLPGLSQLEHLNMNSVNLSGATSWVKVINKLPSLVEIHFHDCSLNFLASQLNIPVNITSLELLDLSHNYMHSVFPRWIFQLNMLIYLDISANSFEGPIPTVSNTTNLQHIDLSNNRFNSTIPVWLYFCKGLKFLSLCNTGRIHGTISNSIANLTSLHTLNLALNRHSGKIPREIANLCNMQKLFLSGNEFRGEINDSFGNMSACFLESLEFLYLTENQLSGHLTDQFGEFTSLRGLYLSENALSGNLPVSLGQLFNLEYLAIDYNMFEGIVTESHFAHLTKLKALAASGNHLTLKVNPNWLPPFKLHTLQLGSWNLGVGTGIPLWLETQENISDLDLSSTGISGNVPEWFWNIRFLNLSNNHLSGKIPYISGSVGVYLSSNQFSGPLPRIAKNMTDLDLSYNSFSEGISHFLCDMTNHVYGVVMLHLGGNQLTGEIPDCWMKFPHLIYLNLGSNNMFGSIPNSIGFLPNLLSLNLNYNNFSGPIPFSMRNCTKLQKIDLGHNDLDGYIPTWMGTSIQDLRILILRSNKLSGIFSSNLCRLNYLQILDLSNNKLSRTIPRCVSNFTTMAGRISPANQLYSARILSYSGKWIFLDSALATTKGRENHYDTILRFVTNIDLSRNDLSGNIPKELTSLAGLRSLNLSSNHFTGFISDSIGDMKQLESLDFSRNSLTGEIPNSFTIMFSLNFLNLSYNNLTGKIPQSTQILTLTDSSFIGNNLCGRPLPFNCSNGDEVEAPRAVSKEEEDNEGNNLSSIDWFYVFVFLGYAVGFSAVCTTLVLKKSWREAYFRWLENMGNIVYFHTNWKRFTEP